MPPAKKLTVSALLVGSVVASVVLLALALLFGDASARAGEPARAKADASTQPTPPTPPTNEVTLKGTLGCGKCSFHEAKECENVLKVKRADANGKGEVEDTYLLADNDVSRANHEKVCGPASPATVTGTVSEPKPSAKKRKNATRKLLTASSISFD